MYTRELLCMCDTTGKPLATLTHTSLCVAYTSQLYIYICVCVCVCVRVFKSPRDEADHEREVFPLIVCRKDHRERGGCRWRHLLPYELVVVVVVSLSLSLQEERLPAASRESNRNGVRLASLGGEN